MRGSHTVGKTRPDGECRWGGGVPHVVSLHSDKLCSVDMPQALNKPVAAPRVEPIAVDRRVRIKCAKRFHREHITGACLLFWVHSERCHIFCFELHVTRCIVFTSWYRSM